MLFVVLCAIAAFLVRSVAIAPFNIPSESMLPNFMVGDYIVATKWNYGYSRYSTAFGLLPPGRRWGGSDPARGDIVVFAGPFNPSTTFIKRIVGMPGDTVQMRRGIVWLNGKPVPQRAIPDLIVPISPNKTCLSIPGVIDLRTTMRDGRLGCRYLRRIETLPSGPSYTVLDFAVARSDDTAPFHVPADHYFMLGDNRDDSADSRFSRRVGGLEMVPADRIIGKARLIFFSSDGNAAWLKPWTWRSGIRWDRLGTIGKSHPDAIADLSLATTATR